MTQEQKELLLKDLSARLPYKVKCKYYDYCEGDYEERIITGYDDREYMQMEGVCIYVEEVKPYLFPMSNMTEEQKREYNSLCEVCTNDWGNDMYFDTIDSIDWLLKNHFDIRGLIPMGLAIDATKLNIY